MRLRQSLLRSGFLNRESPWSVTTLKIFETVDRYAGCPCCELQQPGFLFGVPAADTGPEISDDLVLLCIAPVVGVFLPVLNIDVSNTSD